MNCQRCNAKRAPLTKGSVVRHYAALCDECVREYLEVVCDALDRYKAQTLARLLVPEENK